MENEGQKRGPGRMVVPVAVAAGAAAVAATYQNWERWLREGLIYLSQAAWARHTVSRMPLSWQVANRFVAGETVVEAMNVARELNRQGLMVTLDYLGESVTNTGVAAAARDEILSLLDCIYLDRLKANVSVKLSQLGVKVEKEAAVANLRLILARARQYGARVRIDMEESALVDTTLAIYRQLHDEEGFDNVGVVIQAYLYRSPADVEQLIAEGAWVRLTKGAYAEPAEIAFADKADTDANFVRLMEMMLSPEARANSVHLAVATHDEEMIQATIDYAQRNGVARDGFEFQMLYGIRRELQLSLARQGYCVRIYVPYGTAWYPYFVRRLAERPANLWFFISNLFRR